MARETKQQTIDRLTREILNLRSSLINKEEYLDTVKRKIDKAICIHPNISERGTVMQAVECLIERFHSLKNELRVLEREIEMRKEQEEKLWKLSQDVIIYPNNEGIVIEAVDITDLGTRVSGRTIRPDKDREERSRENFFKKRVFPRYARD